MSYNHLIAMVALSKLVAVTEFLCEVIDPQFCEVLDSIVDDFKKVLDNIK